MKAASLILLMWLGAVAAFFLSGFVANWMYEINGCIWTSGSVFGASFLAFASALGAGAAHLFDLTDWFS
jgi:uncharacterized membrane protein YgcG